MSKTQSEHDAVAKRLDWKPPGPHDYVPGDYTHPMQTDPNCIECGQVKRSPVHR